MLPALADAILPHRPTTMQADPDCDDACCPYTLRALLLTSADPDQVLIIDVRPLALHAAGHIKGSLMLSFSQLLLRRVQKLTAVNLDDVVLTNKEQFARRRIPGCAIVIVDEAGLLAPQKPLSLLLNMLKAEGLHPHFLQGGYSSFAQIAPELCNAHQSVPLIPLTLAPPIAHQHSCSPVDVPASHILPYLIMSGERDANDPAFIRTHKITHVLNLTNARNADPVLALARCYQIPLADTTSQTIIDILPEAVRFIDEAKTLGGIVLVHCFAGISRSAAITIAYFIHSYRMTVDEAYRAVKEKRPNISPNLNFMGQLQSYQQQQSRQLQTVPTFGRQLSLRCSTAAVSFDSDSSDTTTASVHSDISVDTEHPAQLA